MPIGLLLARVRLLRVALETYIMVLYATPMVALIPFILSMMGFGFAPKVLVVFLFAVFPMLYNTIEGRAQPEAGNDRGGAARSAPSEWAIWRDVLVPYTLPFAMTGMRLAIGRGLVGMVAAEFFLSGSGLGLLIMPQRPGFRHRRVLRRRSWSSGMIGVGLMGVGRLLEKHFARMAGIAPMSAPASSARVAAGKRSRRRSAAAERCRLRLIAGIAILLVWEIVVWLWRRPMSRSPSADRHGDPARGHQSGASGRPPALRSRRVVQGWRSPSSLGTAGRRCHRPHPPVSSACCSLTSTASSPCR